MALLLSASISQFLSRASSPAKQFKAFRVNQVYMRSSVQGWGCSSGGSMRVVAQSNEPSIPKIQLSEVRKKLLEVVPASVKQVPWKTVESVFLSKLLDVGEKALKWIFIPLCALSALCDVIFSVLKNKELLIPTGLFVGYILSDFFNGTLQELFSKSEETGSGQQLLYVSAFFVLTRFFASSLPLSASVFFMHVANGGLMQVLWLWRNSQQSNRDGTEVNVPIEDG